ncbi:MAG: HlyD family efflux transporter periplasmic adaptor subunit [Pseudomonadota bacterium]
MRFLRRSLTGVFLLSVTLTLILWAGVMVQGAVQERLSAEPRSFPQRERVLAVNVLEVVPQQITPELTVFGELRSTRTLDLRSATGGNVLSVSDALVEGGAVREGERLLQIDPAEAQAALSRAEADLQDAEAELRDAERALVLAEDELTAARDQASLRDQALTRAQDLQARGVGTAAAVETAELSASSAEATVLTRRQALATAEARVDQAATRLTRAEISLTEAARVLSQTEVFAAFDGTLSEVTIAPGGRVTANERFAELVDPSALEVSFRVSTAQYARLLDDAGALTRADVTIALDVVGVNLQAIGRITREGATVAAGQTGRLLFAQLDAAPGFRSGDFVTVSIAEPALTNVALVPATAVGSDGAVLALDAEERLRAIPVTILRRQRDNVIIAPGDAAGETIVAARSPLLGSGIKVRPIAPAGEVAETAPAMITLDADRRARLIAFVSEGRMPDDVKARIIGQLEQDEVPSETVARLESRMGS